MESVNIPYGKRIPRQSGNFFQSLRVTLKIVVRTHPVKISSHTYVNRLTVDGIALFKSYVEKYIIKYCHHESWLFWVILQLHRMNADKKQRSMRSYGEEKRNGNVVSRSFKNRWSQCIDVTRRHAVPRWSSSKAVCCMVSWLHSQEAPVVRTTLTSGRMLMPKSDGYSYCRCYF